MVVTHGPGIDFLLEGAANQTGQPFSGSVAVKLMCSPVSNGFSIFALRPASASVPVIF